MNSTNISLKSYCRLKSFNVLYDLKTFKYCSRPMHLCKPTSFYLIKYGNNVQSLNSSIIQTRSTLFNQLRSQLPNFALFSNEPPEEVDAITYENVCEETLDSLCEFFEDVVEKYPNLKAADVSFGDGVLTVSLDKFGTYVINRQSPNKQIWLSSPTSGPKRYNFVPSRNGWVYRHDNKTLHSLLQEELSKITQTTVDLSVCAHCGDFK